MGFVNVKKWVNVFKLFYKYHFFLIPDTRLEAVTGTENTKYGETPISSVSVAHRWLLQYYVFDTQVLSISNFLHSDSKFTF